MVFSPIFFELHQPEFRVLAGSSDRLLYSDPLEVLIMVGNGNDNLPASTQEFYQTALKEHSQT